MTKPKEKRQNGQKKKTPQKRGHNGGGRLPMDDIFDDPKNIEKLRDLAAHFLTIDQIATQFGIVRSTFYKILDRRPHLREVMEQGKSDTIKMASSKALELIADGDKDMIKFALRSKAGWTEQLEVNHSGKVEQEITLAAVKRIDQMPPEQRAARLEELKKLRAMDADIIDVEVD